MQHDCFLDKGVVTGAPQELSRWVQPWGADVPLVRGRPVLVAVVTSSWYGPLDGLRDDCWTYGDSPSSWDYRNWARTPHIRLLLNHGCWGNIKYQKPPSERGSGWGSGSGGRPSQDPGGPRGRDQGHSVTLELQFSICKGSPEPSLEVYITKSPRLSQPQSKKLTDLVQMVEKFNRHVEF